MSQNPFEAPRAAESYASPMADPTQARETFDIGIALSEAWERTTQNAVPVIVGTLVAWILITLSVLTLVGIPLLAPVLAYGWFRLLLDAHDGEADLSALFSGFSSYGHALGGMLMWFLAMLVLSIPNYALSFLGAYLELPLLSILGSLVGLVIAFTVTIRLYFAFFFIVDQRMGGIEALQASWDVTRNQKLMTFLLSLLVAIIGVLGLFALVVGILFTIPLSYMVYASCYRQMVPAPAPTYGEGAPAYY